MYLDLETVGFPSDPDARVILACWITKDGVRKHSWIERDGWGELARDWDGSLTAQNARFELQWLLREGVITTQQLAELEVYDTFLAEWVLRGEEELNLDAICKRYKVRGKDKFPSLLLKRGVPADEIPFLLDYCWQDVDATVRVRARQEKLARELALEHLICQRNKVLPVLVDMSTRPQLLDKQLVTGKYESVYSSIQAIDTVLCKYECNLNSGKQLAELLYDKLGFEVPTARGEPILTGSGQRSTSEATLHLLEPKTEEQREFLELYFKRNKLSSLLTKYLNYFTLCNGELWGEIVQGQTATHRLASHGRKIKHGKKKLGCQIQNIPRELKGLICAPEGWSVVEADYAQLEFVAAADMCGDEQAVYDIRTGRKELGTDPHSVTAKFLTEHKQPTTRQDAKSVTFTPLYGGFGKTKAERKYVQYFKDRYKGIARTQEGWAREVVMSPEKELVTPYGMRFRFPKCQLSSTGYITSSTQILNYPLQGLATGEIVPIALRLVWDRIVGLEWCYVSSTVHDSIVLVCRNDRLSDLLEILKGCMLDGVLDYLKREYKYTFTTPLEIEIKAGTHWGSSENGTWSYKT